MKTIQILKKYYTTINNLIRDILDSNDPKSMFEKDFRGQLFAIEGILRLQLKSPKNKLSNKENKQLEKILLNTKEIEDQLGAYSLLFELVEFTDKNVDETQLEQFKKRIKQEQEESFLKLRKQLGNYKKTSKKDFEDLSKINWAEKEKKFIKKSLKSELERINDKITKDLASLILAKKYGYEELEEGFHEFRRAIRWISIYIQGYKPFFSLGELPKDLNDENLKLVETFKDNPFCQLSKGEDLIEINALKYYRLSYHISHIGKIKTQGEMIYYLKERGVHLKSDEKIEKLAHESYNNFIKDKVFKHFID